MASHCLEFERNITHAATNHDGSELAVLSGMFVYVYGRQSDSNPSAGFVLKREVDIHPSGELIVLQISYYGDKDILLLLKDLSIDEFCVFHLGKGHDIDFQLDYGTDRATLNAKKVCRLTSSLDHSKAFVIVDDKLFRLFQRTCAAPPQELTEDEDLIVDAVSEKSADDEDIFDHVEPSSTTSYVLRAEEFCRFRGVPIRAHVVDLGIAMQLQGDSEGGWVNGNTENNFAVSLSADKILRANDKKFMRDCTSFVVTPWHIIVTTSGKLLKFIHVTGVKTKSRSMGGFCLCTDLFPELEVPPDQPETDERCRRIEDGAKLVAAMPSKSSVIMQMPRGNLETIYPRAMVLPGVRRDIMGYDYKSAFRVCRSLKVDMNILHDYMPEQFMHHIKSLTQVWEVDDINVFLRQLR